MEELKGISDLFQKESGTAGNKTKIRYNRKGIPGKVPLKIYSRGGTTDRLNQGSYHRVAKAMMLQQ